MKGQLDEGISGNMCSGASPVPPWSWSYFLQIAILKHREQEILAYCHGAVRLGLSTSTRPPTVCPEGGNHGVAVGGEMEGQGWHQG